MGKEGEGRRLTVVAEKADDSVVTQSGQVECVSNKERYPAHWVSDAAPNFEDTRKLPVIACD